MQSLRLLLFALCSIAFAAECFNDEKRTTTIPTADQIRAAVTSPGSLEKICGGTWRMGDDKQLENTFNHGYLLLSVQRANSSVPLRHCMGAFEDIVTQCIEGAGLWGGFWTLDGEVYNISNSNYPHNPLLPGDDGGPGSLEPNSGPCDYPKHSPATFVDSGAAQYLQDFLATNGDNNWLFAMERATTNSQGTAEEPTCGDIHSTNCPPSKDCREYTPTEFFYVRLVSGLVNKFFIRAHEKLQDKTILSILAIDKIIADFEPDPARAVDPNILNTMAGGLTMAGAVMGAASGPAGAILNFFGGVMTVVGANVGAPEVLNIEAVRSSASDHLSTIFRDTGKAMESLLARLFGKTDNEYSLSGLVDDMKNRGFPPVADDWDPTAVILSMPWMGESESVNLDDIFGTVVGLMNQGLVGAILKAMGYLVIVIKNLSESECSMKAGAQYIDNDCYVVSTGCDGHAYGDMGADKIKLLPEDYGIDMVEFFKNVQECSKHRDDPSIGSQTRYPTCFFNLDFKETNLYHEETCPLPGMHMGCIPVVYHKPCD
ncbi:hypothetical protein LCI18_005426 [Fusarium solani-melongenae]|uniref:Uncharacterized protein n=1 Tax=Fusarium solani subsp. cucurbitae TaxID=2747967 RepID=A0ACD3Z0T5_FUSSC|nr:hypothetical protein LCI18_005426 [Fusarium solani-melongenae]